MLRLRDIKKLPSVERDTFYKDTFRAGIDGVMACLNEAVFMIIAIQLYRVSDFYKGLIVSAPFYGHLLNLGLVALAARTNLKKSFLVGTYTLGSALALFIAAFSRTGVGFSLAVVASLMFFNFRIPILTGIYEENYDHRRRGRLYSTGVILFSTISIGANALFGGLLERDYGLFRVVLLISGVLMLVNAGIMYSLSASPVRAAKARNPLKNVGLIFKYPVFGYILLAWFIIGFANLWTLPVRAVLVAESERGLGMNPLMAVFILSILPAIIRLLFNPVWAWFFDRINFVRIRFLMNAFISTGILVFFLAKGPGLLIAGTVIMNLGFAGATIVWNLWVTKVAPKGESQVFMSVHTFLAGIRGMIGPMLGLAVFSMLSVRGMGYIAFAMGMVSCLVLLPLVLQKNPRLNRMRGERT